MGLDASVTYRKLQLGTHDATTGWYDKDYAPDDTIDLILVPRGATSTNLPAGVYVRLDAVGLTADVVFEGDQIVTDAGEYYEVKTVLEHYLLDSFMYRECQLSRLPLENLTGGTYTPSTVEDARYRTKDYLETYLTAAALPRYIVAYGKPNYPMTRVFKTKGVDLIFSLGEPTSEALPDFDHYAIGYNEHVPVAILCIDKDNIDGTKLMWQAETELRRVTETYPEGSLRALEPRRPRTERLGSVTLYSAEYSIDYLRDTT